jgi:hypothetical protein
MLLLVGIAVLLVCFAAMAIIVHVSAEDEPPATLESGQSHMRSPPR